MSMSRIELCYFWKVILNCTLIHEEWMNEASMIMNVMMICWLEGYFSIFTYECKWGVNWKVFLNWTPMNANGILRWKVIFIFESMSYPMNVGVGWDGMDAPPWGGAECLVIVSNFQPLLLLSGALCRASCHPSLQYGLLSQFGL